MALGHSLIVGDVLSPFRLAQGPEGKDCIPHHSLGFVVNDEAKAGFTRPGLQVLAEGWQGARERVKVLDRTIVADTAEH
jgi:hypothetical protein